MSTSDTSFCLKITSPHFRFCFFFSSHFLELLTAIKTKIFDTIIVKRFKSWLFLLIVLTRITSLLLIRILHHNYKTCQPLHFPPLPSSWTKLLMEIMPELSHLLCSFKDLCKIGANSLNNVATTWKDYRRSKSFRSPQKYNGRRMKMSYNYMYVYDSVGGMYICMNCYGGNGYCCGNHIIHGTDNENNR